MTTAIKGGDYYLDYGQHIFLVLIAPLCTLLNYILRATLIVDLDPELPRLTTSSSIYTGVDT